MKNTGRKKPLRVHLGKIDVPSNANIQMNVEYLHDGSRDCPLVRLFDFKTSEALHLKDTFDALAADQVQEVVLTDLPDVSGADGCRLVLKVGTRDRGVVQLDSALSFVCLLSCEGWKTVADLTAPFCFGTMPGHYQWLDVTSHISLLLSYSGSW